jgi:hypothetical protein
MQAYKIVQTVAGQLVAICPTNIYAWAEVNGHSVYHLNSLHLRAELQLQPSIQGFCGPMYDGINEAGLPVVRYEDQASYNTLSV